MGFNQKISNFDNDKGQKDRALPLPLILLSDLEAQRESVKRLHQEDLAAGYAGIFFPNAFSESTKMPSRSLFGSNCFRQKS